MAQRRHDMSGPLVERRQGEKTGESDSVHLGHHLAIPAAPSGVNTLDR